MTATHADRWPVHPDLPHNPDTCDGCKAVRAIPAHRVNAWCKRIGSFDGRTDIRPDGGPELGDEHDTHGAGSMYRNEGMWRWDGITDRHKKGNR